MQTRHMQAVVLLSEMLLCLGFISDATAGDGFETCPDWMTEEECSKALDFLRGKSATNIRSDLLVPDSPAFSVLDVVPEAVIRPESPRDLAISILNGVDPRGNIQSGIAIDTTPYVLTGVDLIDYRTDPFERFLSRTQLSISSVKGGSDDSSARASIGLRFTLFDPCDARLDRSLDLAFYRAIRAARAREKAELVRLSDVLEKLAIELAQAQSEGDEARVKEVKDAMESVDAEREELERLTEKDLREQWTAVLKEREIGQWNATSAAIGIAPVFFSEDGTYENLESEGFAIYGTLSYGFDHFGRFQAEHGAGKWLSRNANLLFHARHVAGQKEPLEDSSVFREQDVTVIGTQIRVRGPKVWSDQKGGDLAFALEADYVLKDIEGDNDDDTLRITGVAELKPFKNSGFTLKVAAGSESKGDQDDRAFIVTTINWALD